MAISATLLAPAKLNLWLQLTGVKRPDGRHELDSHFAPLALADVLRIEAADAFALCVSGPFAQGVPTDQANLVWQAFSGFGQAFGTQPGLHIQIEKNIPHGAGLGGGSSDAGALLAYLAAQAKVPLDAVRAWSCVLGADIPAAIGAHSGHVAGIGDILGETLPLPHQHVLLVKPKASCPTREVFANWRADLPKPLASQNDLEVAACLVCPEIRDILTYLRSAVSPDAQMTGSGSACFALFDPNHTDIKAHRKALSDHWIFETKFKTLGENLASEQPAHGFD